MQNIANCKILQIYIYTCRNIYLWLLSSWREYSFLTKEKFTLQYFGRFDNIKKYIHFLCQLMNIARSHPDNSLRTNTTWNNSHPDSSHEEIHKWTTHTWTNAIRSILTQTTANRTILTWTTPPRITPIPTTSTRKIPIPENSHPDKTHPENIPNIYIFFKIKYAARRVPWKGKTV